MRLLRRHGRVLGTLSQDQSARIERTSAKSRFAKNQALAEDQILPSGVGCCPSADPILDKREVTFRVRQETHARTARDERSGTTNATEDAGSRPVLGLLVVLAFLGHDVIMAAPRPALAAERPSLALTLDVLEASRVEPASAWLSHWPTMRAQGPGGTTRQSATSVHLGHPDPDPTGWTAFVRRRYPGALPHGAAGCAAGLPHLGRSSCPRSRRQRSVEIVSPPRRDVGGPTEGILNASHPVPLDRRGRVDRARLAMAPANLTAAQTPAADHEQHHPGTPEAGTAATDPVSLAVRPQPPACPRPG